MSLREVDGSHGEGGGQILRTSLALATLTGEPLRVVNIRAGRPKPGLAPQHLAAVKALVDLCDAAAEGLSPRSTEVTFRPGVVRGGLHDVDVGTAGSVTMVLQTLLLPALHADAPVRLRITGGTDVRWAPPADHTGEVFLPLLRRMGGRVSFRILRRGYYPRGGGRVEAAVEPTEGFHPLAAGSRTELRGIRGRAHIANLPADIPKRMERAARKALAAYPDVRVEAVTYGPEDAEGRGGATVLWAVTDETRLGAGALAEKGVPAEDVGGQAARALAQALEAGATLDVYTADQLLPYMALGRGPSAFRVRELSGHLETLFWLLPQLLDVDFAVEEDGAAVGVEVLPSRTST